MTYTRSEIANPKSEMITHFSSPDTFEVSAEQMTCLVKAEKEYLAKKGIEFNCAILQGEKDQVDELKNFLTSLKANLSDHPDGMRISYLFSYRVNPSKLTHWTGTDVRILNGKPEFYILDSVGYWPDLFIQILKIYHIFPNAKITYSPLSIQDDIENCAYFALYTLVASRKKNIHDLSDKTHPACDNKVNENWIKLLVAMASHGKCEDDDKGLSSLHYALRNIFFENLSSDLIPALRKILYIPSENIPKEYGSLFKNTQKKEFKSEDYICHNGKTLTSIIRKNQQEIIKNNKIKITNMRIYKWREKIKQRGLAYIQNEEKVDNSTAQVNDDSLKNQSIFNQSLKSTSPKLFQDNKHTKVTLDDTQKEESHSKCSLM